MWFYVENFANIFWQAFLDDPGFRLDIHGVKGCQGVAGIGLRETFSRNLITGIGKFPLTKKLKRT